MDCHYNIAKTTNRMVASDFCTVLHIYICFHEKWHLLPEVHFMIPQRAPHIPAPVLCSLAMCSMNDLSVNV